MRASSKTRPEPPNCVVVVVAVVVRQPSIVIVDASGYTTPVSRQGGKGTIVYDSSLGETDIHFFFCSNGTRIPPIKGT